MPKTALSLENLLERLVADFPEVSFVESDRFSWHAGKRSIAYSRGHAEAENTFSLFHELGHALLQHQSYTYDMELLQIEVAAWDKAREVAIRYDISLDEDHIQDCLDTYRDWLHLRATCPTCFSRSLQATSSRYHCFNCKTEWSVTVSRLCRPYRLQQAQKVR
jgi:hypothetical protein